tara:strand:+ start:595 stop:858 length:264 start_codon:yes stop_codon:yes gene_type:complete
MSELVIDGVKFRQSGLNNIVLLHGKHKLSIAQHVSPLMKDDHSEPIATHEIAIISEEEDERIFLYNPTPISLANTLLNVVTYLNNKY